MTIKWLPVVLAIASAASLSCARRVPSPEPVPLDRVECARCRMLISTESGGGQILSAAEEPRFYDDIGCLAADWHDHAAGAHAYVRLAAGSWVEAAAAVYARPAGARTAMGSGLAAYASPEEARTADSGGRTMIFADVVQLAGARR